MGVPSRTSATTPALDQTFDFQIIPGKVRPFLRRLAEAHPQVLIIALLHHLRTDSRSYRLVRRLHRYYGAVRLPMLVHLRITAFALPERPVWRSTSRASMGSPGSRAWRFRACNGSPTARGPLAARA